MKQCRIAHTTLSSNSGSFTQVIFKALKHGFHLVS